MTTPDTYLSWVDPSHIWTVCARAAGRSAEGLLILPGDGYGARACLPARPAARKAHAALSRVGYQVLSGTGRQGRDLTIYGWSAERLESRLTAMRGVLHQLAATPGSTAATVLSQLGRVPLSELPDQAGRQRLVDQAGAELRRWISATSGIHAPCDPLARPADTGCALRLTATWRAEEAIDNLVDQHLQTAWHALALYPDLRQTTSHTRAREAALRQAGATAQPSQEVTRDTSSLPRDGSPPRGPAPPGRPAAGRRPRRGPPPSSPPPAPRPRRTSARHPPGAPDRRDGTARSADRDSIAGPANPRHRSPATPRPARIQDGRKPTQMEAETHPDPIREALQHGLQRALQVGSFAGTVTQVFVYHQRTQARIVAEKDERARRALQAHIHGEREAARAGWVPALDPHWLRTASLYDAARTWGAAAPYADRSVPWYEPSAAAALRKSEGRLTQLHPYAMARYERLRADGLSPADAMREAAPLFARHPRAYDSPFMPRPVLDASTAADADWVADASEPGSAPGEDPSLKAQELRGRDILAALQERAQVEGRDPLGHDELRTVLETITNLPVGVIERITRPTAGETQARPEPERAAAERARPWERDFPLPIRDVVATAASAPAPPVPRAATARPAVRRAPRPGGPGHV